MKSEAISPRVVRLLILATAATLGLGGGVAAAKSAPATAESSPGEQEESNVSSSNTEAAVVEESSPAPGEEGLGEEREEGKVIRRRLSNQFPDREWILDEETGKRFMIERIPKLKGAYLWEDENHVRLPGGLFHMEVVDHNDTWFWIKIYDRQPRFGTKSKKTGPSEEDLAAVAATYATRTETVDRLRFESFDEGLPSQGQWRNGFDIADMNGDGHLDIVFGPARKGRSRPNIFLSDGAGHWHLWRDARYPDLPYDYGDAVAGDWNGDGHMDLALGIHMLGMVALVNDGKGGFEPWTEGIELARPGKGETTTFSSRAVQAIDWNHDGKLDLIAFGEGPKGLSLTPRRRQGSPRVNNSRGLLVYLNQGDGTWEATRVEQATRDFGDGFEIGDWNGDGKADVIVVSSVHNNHHILRNSRPDEDQLEPEKLEGLRPDIFTTAVAAFDLDGKAGEELVVAYISHEMETWRSGIDVFSWREERWQRRPLIAEEGRKGFHALDLGDLDGDGNPDLVALTGAGEVLVFVGDGEGFFRRELTPELPPAVPGCKGWDVRLVDLDGDSTSEVVASFAGERTGPELVPEAMRPGCPGRGRINVWKVVPRDSGGEGEPAS